MIYATDVVRCGFDGHPIEDVEGDPLIGKTVGRYFISRALGRGAMGCVYQASHAELANRAYAIKVLFGEMAANRTVAGRFRREAEIASTMTHENVVPVVDMGVTEQGITFLVMEFVSGQSLEDAISAGAPFEFERAALLARGIANGLSHAHGLGFVHRDLKPANIMLALREDGEVPKLLDFGIAGITEEGPVSTKLTQTGHTMGTPLYMAPEQFRSATVGPTADIYALGAIIYEMITGRPPFSGNMGEMAFAKISGDIEQPPDAGGLGALAMHLMRPEPVDRPQTGKHVRDMLDQLVVSKSGPIAFFRGSSAPIAGVSRSAPEMDAMRSTNSLQTTMDFESAASRRRAIVVGAVGATAVALAALVGFVVVGNDVGQVRPLEIETLEPLTSKTPSYAVPPPELVAPTPTPPAPERPDASSAIGATVAQKSIATPRPVSRTRKSETSRKLPIEAEVDLTPPIQPPVKKAVGRVNVIVTREGAMLVAAVTIDGKPSGNTPLSTQLPAGRHEIQVSLPDAPAMTKTVDVTGGLTARAIFRFP